ncbi:ABC transporter substrate-binding protein [Sedimentitalea sp. JM2-8]|uniref:ABC transporter substrate-binding protein n=1 Tax=Sedimentitalea xiamensis TaxID=3050037 RepID=A0ABT7FFI6_9RHOB|nr:ABC transporter substrate-binding protein [Sedimentitalea xiamensis]MDK3073885.1 ABC transporter substrate-binding protein [Sedimentitalea xiamensis]
MRQVFGIVAALVLGIWTSVAAAGSETPVVRVAVLQIGTVNWELDTIERNGFDAANGFDLTVLPFADNGATRVAFEGGEADAAVVDWIWVARQRAAGKDYVFIPYSRAVGGLVVPDTSPARTLADMAGKKIGIAGGPLDKSWLILRAYARQEFELDLEGETEQVYGAPPLIYKTAVAGETDGAINFWHFLARMKAEGMRELISVSDASVALGLDPDVPLLGYVMKESFLAAHPGIAEAFHAATRQSKSLLARDDDAWQPLRDRMNAQTEAQFTALREDFRAGIPPDAPVDADSADRLLRLMAELGGEALVGAAVTLPPGVFARTR